MVQDTLPEDPGDSSEMTGHNRLKFSVMSMWTHDLKDGQAVTSPKCTFNKIRGMSLEGNGTL